LGLSVSGGEASYSFAPVPARRLAINSKRSGAAVAALACGAFAEVSPYFVRLKLILAENLWQRKMTQSPDPENLRLLLEQKVAYLNMVANVAMVWWVSSVVFSASALGSLWRQRGELGLTALQARRLSRLVTTFFVTIVLFGFAVIAYLLYLRRSLHATLTALRLSTNSFDGEIVTFVVAMLLGTSSFVLVLVLWLGMRKQVIEGVSQEQRSAAAVE
jgi:hypothetical protein